MPGHQYNPDGGGYDPDPPGGKGGGSGGGTPSKKVPGISPGAITSTGGLFGDFALNLIPVFDPSSNAYYLCTWDSNDFNCEEDVQYDFPQVNIVNNRAVTSHNVIVKYRNLGVVTVTFNLTVFRKGITTIVKGEAVPQEGTFKTVSKTLKIGSKKADQKIYTREFNMVNSGERPQLSFSRAANKGQLAIIDVMLVGNADEKENV